MCILIVKPKNVLTPSKEILQECYKSNPDGAGFCYNKNNCIVLRKGFMTFDDFYNASQKIPVDSTAIIHCRIGTSGGNVAGLTHPYPLTNDIKAMKKTTNLLKPKGKKVYAVGHNGIFYGLNETGEVNDTCMFIANILNPLKDMAKDILDDSLDAVINRLVDTSKIAIMDNEGNYKKYGSGWIEDNGVYYSNSTYKKTTYTYYNKKYCGREKWIDYVIDEFGSQDNYIEWVQMSEDEKFEELLKKYPTWKTYIENYKKLGYSAYQIRNWISEDLYEVGDPYCKGYYNNYWDYDY